MNDIQELMKQAQEALESKDNQKAKELIAQIKAIKDQENELNDLSNELKDLAGKSEDKKTDEPEKEETSVPEDDSEAVSEPKDEEEPAEEAEDVPDPDKDKDKKEKRDDSEAEEVPEAEEEDLEEPKKDEKRKDDHQEMKPIKEENLETRALGAYIKSKGLEKREGLTTEGAEAVIPVQTLTTPQEQPRTVPDLRQLANRIKVKTGSGSYPVLKATKAKMNTVEELQKNPELAKPEFIKVPWEIKTYRGYIPVSKESLDDSDQNLAGIVADNINQQSLNTSNASISAVLQTATTKMITGIDGLKDIINTAIDPAYNVGFVVSQSFFNEVDKLKDNDGRYILQQDVTKPSGYALLGRQVVVMADDIIGKKAGDQVAFVGDVKAFVAYFDRAQATVRWTDNDVYGELLAGMIRFDVEATDKEAGYYVTLKLAETPAP